MSMVRFFEGGGIMRKFFTCCERPAALAFTLLLICGGPAAAVENGIGIYILGQSGPQAGMMPPVSGVFSTNFAYVYSGKVSGGIGLPIGGNLAVDVDVDIVVGAPGLMWVPETEVLGWATRHLRCSAVRRR